MTAENKQADRQTASGLTFQELAQKNRLDAKLDQRLAEIVRAKGGEPDPED